MKCRGPCGENKPKEAFEIRGKPEGEGICYACTKLIRKEKRRAYTREYYRKYRLEHPEQTLLAQKKAQEKLKARRHEAKLQKAIKLYLESNIIQATPEQKEQTSRLRTLEGIKSRLQEKREELRLEMQELKKLNDMTLYSEIEKEDLRTQLLVKSLEEQIRGM